MRWAKWVSAAIVVGVCALRLNSNTAWAGDWNETGNTLIGIAALGSTLAGLIAAVLVRRNLAPLATLGIKPTPWRLARYLIRTYWTPSLLAWLVAVGGAYGVTAAVNPTPSAASPGPVLAATAVLIWGLSTSTACGCLLRPAFAVPATFLCGYVLPVTIAWADSGHDLDSFTPYSNLHLPLPLIANNVHFALQAGFFLALAGLALGLAVARLLSKSLKRAASVGIVATILMAIPLALNSESSIENPPPITAMVCRETAGIESTITVCTLADHRRFLSELTQTVAEVEKAIPEGLHPKAYVEDGLALPAGIAEADTARVSAETVRLDRMNAVTDAVADWQVCTEGWQGMDLSFARSLWLSHRLGQIDEDTVEGALGRGWLARNSAADQERWWREPMGVPCSGQ